MLHYFFPQWVYTWYSTDNLRHNSFLDIRIGSIRYAVNILGKSLPDRGLDYNTSERCVDFIKIIWRWCRVSSSIQNVVIYPFRLDMFLSPLRKGDGRLFASLSSLLEGTCFGKSNSSIKLSQLALFALSPVYIPHSSRYCWDD